LFDSHELMFEATSTIPSIGAGSVPGYGADAMGDLADMRRMATLGFYVSDTSSGRVRRLRTGEALATYKLNELDTKRMAIGIVTAAEILLAAGAKKVYPGLPGIDSVAAAADVEMLKEKTFKAAQLRLTAFHPMGTTRMGEDPSRAVVDSRGRHHGIRGLWVADASIFPSCVGVNPQIGIMGFARRTAMAIKEEAFS
jgi:choline dehydrogenase-like flavoprotein